MKKKKKNCPYSLNEKKKNCPFSLNAPTALMKTAPTALTPSFFSKFPPSALKKKKKKNSPPSALIKAEGANFADLFLISSSFFPPSGPLLPKRESRSYSRRAPALLVFFGLKLSPSALIEQWLKFPPSALIGEEEEEEEEEERLRFLPNSLPPSSPCGKERGRVG